MRFSEMLAAVAVVSVLMAPVQGRTENTLKSTDAALKSSGAPLKSLWGASKHAPAGGNYDCPATTPLPHDIVAESYYSDAKHSVIDKARYDAYNEAQEQFRGQMKAAEDAADLYQKTGKLAAAHCVVQIVKSDVVADSMTGSMSTNQAYYMQNWTMGALAISYLKVQKSGVMSADNNAAIAAWMVKVGRQVEDYFEARRAKQTKDGRNNHLYWAGYSAMAAAVVGNDHKLFDWGASTYYDGVHFIEADGTLPLEMDRGARALHYHLFALGPLVMMAEFGEDNGLPMYAANNGALHSLVKRTLSGLGSNTYFASKAGVKQDTPEGGKIKSNDVVWAVPYVKRFPNPTISAMIHSVELHGWDYLGGLPPE
ncbi:MAG TPA: alginate lyase family protein [Acidobacteriaceae bacterium]